jgi:hypothetical protein
LNNTVLQIQSCLVNVAAGNTFTTVNGLIGEIYQTNVQIYNVSLVTLNIVLNTSATCSAALIGLSQGSVVNITWLTLNLSYSGSYYGVFNQTKNSNVTLNYTV